MKIVDFGKIQTGHLGLQKIIASLNTLARNHMSFLILGEVGSGRRLMAQLIHENSFAAGLKIEIYRKNEIRPIPEGVVLVSELQFLNFREQEVLIEQMLSSGSKTIWIATAQIDLHELVKRGLIRKDLLAQFQKELRIPSLAERAADRVFLMEHILMTLSWVMGRVLRLSREAQDLLSHYHFVENIRELEQVLESAALLTTGSLIEVEHLKLNHEVKKSTQKISTLAEMERKLIMQTLELTQNNKSQAARLLGISIRTLRNKLSQYRGELNREYSQEVSYE